MSEDHLTTWDDLEQRWQPPGESAAAKRKWVQRRAAHWGLKPLAGTRGKAARFRPTDVLRAEAKAAGERGRR